MADPDFGLVFEYIRRSGDPPAAFQHFFGPEVVWEDEEEAEGDTDEDDDGEDGEPDYITVEDSPSDVLEDNDTTNNVSSSGNLRTEEERNERSRREGEGEAYSSSGRGVGIAGLSQGSEGNRDGDNNGPFCPICMEAWTTDGDHRICCLPCGHLYGMSCIKRWLQLQKPGKCPQCNRRCTVNGIRKLFAPRIAAVDEESNKRIEYLEAKCAALEYKNADWQKKEEAWQKKGFNLQSTVEKLHQKICQLKQRTTHSEGLLGEVHTTADSQGYQHLVPGSRLRSRKIFTRESSFNFTPQIELRLEGARLFDMSTSNQLLLISRRLPGMGARDALTKMSLMYPYETEDIELPPNTKAVKDLCISPLNGDLALFTSLGKRLAVLSLGSNNTVLAFDLPVAAWSCSWDFRTGHYIYAGLQNGNLLVFDMRQTARPLESMNGLSCNPIHSIHSLSHKSSSGFMSVLTASSIGLSQWDIDAADKRTTLIPESASEGVCISLACCPHSDDIVATYRLKTESPTEVSLTQTSLTQSPFMGQVVPGSNVNFKRVGDSFQKMGSACAFVSGIRLPRSALISSKNDKRGVYVSGDEAYRAMDLQELPSFSFSQTFEVSKHPIRDIKYRVAMNQGLLTCLSDDTFQVLCVLLASTSLHDAFLFLLSARKVSFFLLIMCRFSVFGRSICCLGVVLCGWPWQHHLRCMLKSEV